MKLNKIHNEDCRETMKRMPDNFIDLTVTSPPYDNLRTYNDNIDKTWNDAIWKPIIKELFRITKIGGVVVWIVGDATINRSETGTSFRQALYFMKCGFNLHDTMIWTKHTFPKNNNRYEQHFEYMFVFSKDKLKTFNPIKELKIYTDNRKTKKYGRNKDGNFHVGRVVNKIKKIKGNVWHFPVGGGHVTKDDIATKHPAIFPEQLVSDHIYSWSNEGDLIYDPFMGSGTTAKMAHLQKRNWIGSEISKEYVDLAYKRIEPYLMQKRLF
ncbi:MAG: site-specific DNA-methyltransferase [Bacteroidales bacterium]|jgi:site-specific DNA-methyltransferase (adenine-specific)|nr:site-specific DNA-methyltransferase [Bacteroidales bacterium]